MRPVSASPVFLWAEPTSVWDEVALWEAERDVAESRDHAVPRPVAPALGFLPVEAQAGVPDAVATPARGRRKARRAAAAAFG